jgi:hypothetical protein
VRSGLSNSAEIGNVYRLLDRGLEWSIEKFIERNVLEHLVNAEFMRIENHAMSLIFSTVVLKDGKSRMSNARVQQWDGE